MKMNIESLMPSRYPTTYANGKLDINSISTRTNEGEIQKKFNSDELLKNIYGRK
jgi:hypothetical protein